ncbi:MAG: adenine methylase [Actinomycetota bacterium]|jgi:DNA adenine methylase|nr:adenine methylase [Actinomycetota bacterium]
MRFVSPLRYPGGKGALADFLGTLITAQRPACTTYVEPFAGGAGAALRLLLDEYVDEVVLNDLDPGVAAFWRCVFLHPSELIARIRHAKVSIEEWRRQAAIYKAGLADDLDLGYATFFLNRTNRSGILAARPIGGLDQTGRWLIDARFNREQLIGRIEAISRLKNRVVLHEGDGVSLLRTMLPGARTTFFYVDPPYVDKGDDLYLDELTWDDHRTLSALLVASDARWLVTYNCDERIRTELYPRQRCVSFDIKHTAHLQHVGSEYAIFSDSLAVDSLEELGSGTVAYIP